MNERYHESRKLIGLAVSKNPHELYRAIENPLPSRLTTAVVNAISLEASESDHAIDTTEDVVNILRFGVRDTQNAIDPYLRKQSSYQAALEFIDHPKTTQAIAVLALRNEESLTNLLQQLDYDVRRSTTSHPAPHIVLPSRVTPPLEARGCPAAFHDKPEKIDPLFRRFVQWSGRLALDSLSYHRIVPALDDES